MYTSEPIAIFTMVFFGCEIDLSSNLISDFEIDIVFVRVGTIMLLTLNVFTN